MAEPKACIMVIDDNAGQRLIVSTLLKSGGYEIIACASAKEALGILSSKSVDVVVCDLHMPEISGLEFMNMLRADAKLMNIPVVVLTATKSDDALAETLKDADAVCDKLSMRKELLPLVGQLAATKTV